MVLLALDFDCGIWLRVIRCIVAVLKKIRKFEAKIPGIGGVAETSFEINDTCANELIDFAVKVLHSVGIAVAHGIEQRLAFTLALFDVIACAQGGFEHLDGSNATLAVLFGQKTLRDDEPESLTEPRANGLLIAQGGNAD